MGLAYSWKEIYVSNLPEVFTEIRLEEVDLSKISHANTKTQPQMQYFND